MKKPSLVIISVFQYNILINAISHLLFKVPDTFSPKILVLDLMDYKNMDEPVSRGLKLFGHIDILINNAGVSYRGEISSTQIQVDERVMAVNYFGQVALIKGDC